MSGPQGSDSTQPWAGQQPESGNKPQAGDSSASQWQPPSSGSGSSSGSDQPAGDQPSWQPPAYTPPQYPQYQQPGSPSGPAYQQPQQYQPNEQYGQQGSDYPQSYGQPQQYGPPQYGQQYGQPPYGQPQYGQQPGQYGQPQQQPNQFGQYSPYTAPGAEEGSKRSLAVVGGVIGVLAAIIVAAVLVLGFWKPGFFVTTKLDVNAAQTGVQQILTDETNGYGARNVRDVTCNNGQSPTVRKGDSFNCEVSIDGTKRQVTVTFQDDKGTYEVGRPR